MCNVCVVQCLQPATFLPAYGGDLVKSNHRALCSRLAKLLPDFAPAFNQADRVIITEVGLPFFVTISGGLLIRWELSYVIWTQPIQCFSGAIVLKDSPARQVGFQNRSVSRTGRCPKFHRCTGVVHMAVCPANRL
jgi:hypothetical protein